MNVFSSAGEQSLSVLFEHDMTFAQIEHLLMTTEYNGYPVVQTKQQPYLTGFVTRNDLRRAIGSFIHLTITYVSY